MPGEPSEDFAGIRLSTISRITQHTRVPSGRDQAAERRILGRLGIRVKRLRIELGGELDDLGLGQCERAELVGAAGLEVVEVLDAVVDAGGQW